MQPFESGFNHGLLEDDFDFTLRGPRGPQYLDLMELVILPKRAKGGHAAGATVYDPRAMADRVYKLVARKSKRYGRPQSKVHLLLYSTDWRFHLVPPVAEFVALALHRRPHVFTTVTYFAPLAQDDGIVTQIYPVAPDQLADYARRDGHTFLVMLGDPSGAVISPGRAEYTFHFKRCR